MSRPLALVLVVLLLLLCCALPVQAEPAPPVATAATPPHPLLSDVRVRRAIAYCSDRAALVGSVYPYLDANQRNALLMDTFLPKTHWAYAAPDPQYAYPYDPAAGRALLDQAGWTQEPGQLYRRNAEGYELAVSLRTTTAQFRQTWAAALEAQLRECGIHLVREHLPASWLFGDTTGFQRRDFELTAYAWIGEPDPKGRTLYACDQIPTEENGWSGQNYMGWCNPAASAAIIAANSTVNRAERIAQYGIVQREFAKDMVSLPLFQRAEAAAWSSHLQGARVSPTEYVTKSAKDWTRNDGGDTATLVWTQEPPSLFALVENAAVARQAYDLAVGVRHSQYDYDYQPGLQDPLSTVDSGLAKVAVVDVKSGDEVYTADGQRGTLAQGVRIVDANGNVIEYDGSSVIQMKQLTVTYKFKPFTWSDGVPGSAADLALGYRTDCDHESGATSYEICDQVKDISFGPGLQYTTKWLPGALDATYFLAPFYIYPNHQVLSDGRKLAEVPAKEWAALPEIADHPLSYGPYVIQQWVRGQNMTYVRNPHLTPAPALKTVRVRFVGDSQEALNSLLTGVADYVDAATLGAGQEAGQAFQAAQQGLIQAAAIPSPTWEHVDFNLDLYTRTVAKSLSNGGGEVANELGIKLNVPPGAVSAPTTFAIQTAPLAHPAPVRALLSFNITTRDDATGNAVDPLATNPTAEISYADEAVAKAGLGETQLGLWKWTGETWYRRFPCDSGCALDTEANKLTAPLLHFGEFVFGGQLATYLPLIVKPQ